MNLEWIGNDSEMSWRQSKPSKPVEKQMTEIGPANGIDLAFIRVQLKVEDAPDGSVSSECTGIRKAVHVGELKESNQDLFGYKSNGFDSPLELCLACA